MAVPFLYKCIKLIKATKYTFRHVQMFVILYVVENMISSQCMGLMGILA